MSYTIRNATEMSEGDGVNVKRLFPLSNFMNFDPFVLWDHFDIGPEHGFPDHPHRGFEAITYMFEGGMNHKDNLGNASFVTSGGAQRFTAGKGIVHSEMPGTEGDNNGIQLWINLPKKLKKILPSYQQVNKEDFPINELDGGKVKIVVGKGSPIELKSEINYQHVSLENQSHYEINLISKNLNMSMRCIIYLMKGELMIANNTLHKGQALFIEDENQLNISASQNSEFMLCFGLPHNESIHQNGPYVD